MGLFFDRVPSQSQVDIVADAYSHQPPAPGELDNLAGQYLLKLGGAHVTAVTTALRSDEELEPQQARERARAALAGAVAPAQAKFQPLRFTIALLIFLALVGAGIGSDARPSMTADGAAPPLRNMP